MTPRLAKLLAPRRNEYIPHSPTVKQSAFLLLDAREALYGGAAGGGKSDALLMAALQYVDQEGYSALLLRRTHADLALPGALMDRARSWLASTSARWRERDKTWTFPSGATLSFGYLDHPSHRFRYQSSEFQFIGFDELTQFGESEYTYLFSRLRRSRGSKAPLRMRSASNPGGNGHDWVRRRFLIEGREHGRIFVPASLDDNPHLDGDAYVQSLGALDPVTRAQLLHGDWDVHDEGLLSFDDLMACQADCLWTPGREAIHSPRRELFLGVDIGRTRDLTVLWTWERIGDICWCREIGVLSETSFREQKDAIKRSLDRGILRCAIDKGGIGCQLAEELTREHPGVVEGVQLSGGIQGRLAQRLAVAFRERKVRVPDSEELRHDFRLVRKTRVVGGIDRVETHRDRTGHADRFWAAALGFDAAACSPAPTAASLPRALARGTWREPENQRRRR